MLNNKQSIFIKKPEINFLRFFPLLFSFLFTLLSLNVFYQTATAQEEGEKKIVKRQSMADRKRELAKKKEKIKEEEDAALAELKQMHLENQDKKTQKRMKKAMKKANRNNSGKKRSSFKTWFSRKNRY